MHKINQYEWSLVLKLWSFVEIGVSILGGGVALFRLPHITFLELIVELLITYAVSFGIVWLFIFRRGLHYTPTPHFSLRIVQYFFILLAWILIGFAKGFEFAWDPNTTFQFGGAGKGWESTSSLGGLIGIAMGIIVVVVLEILYRQARPRKTLVQNEQT